LFSSVLDVALMIVPNLTNIANFILDTWLFNDKSSQVFWVNCGAELGESFAGTIKNMAMVFRAKASNKVSLCS